MTKINMKMVTIWGLEWSSVHPVQGVSGFTWLHAHTCTMQQLADSLLSGKYCMTAPTIIVSPASV